MPAILKHHLSGGYPRDRYLRQSVEAEQARERALEDGAEGKALTRGRLLEFGLVVPGNAANETDRQVATIIRQDVTKEEIIEIADDNLADSLIVEVAVDELGEGGQKAVGQWLAIDTIDDIGHRQAIFSLKFSLDIFRQNALIKCIQEATA